MLIVMKTSATARDVDAVVKVIQAVGLQLGVEQAEERLGFSFANLVVRIVERQDDAELQLLALA